MQTDESADAPAPLPDGGAPGDTTALSQPVNLADWVRHWTQRRPQATALVDPGDAADPATRRLLSWADLDRRVDAVAAGLTARGLLAGHRLGLLGANSIAYVVAYLAALRAGIVAVPINPQASPSELETLVADSGSRLLLADPALLETPPPGASLLALSEDGLDALAVTGAPVSSPRDAETLAVLLYTAGTSGQAKAAMLTHRALLAHVEHVHQIGLLRPDTVVLASLPLFHVFGLNAVLGSWLRSGARLVVVDGYVDDFCAVLRREQVTNLPLAPTMLQRLLVDDELESSVGGLETVISGAAPLPATLAAEFTARTGVPVAQGYGLTEAAPGVTVSTGSEPLVQGHVGRPLPGVEVRIGDGSDATEPGEIFVRGDNLFSGYWPDGSGGPDAEGWFRTGDIGYLSDGELHLVDRARELVIVHGFNVYPAEVEQVILDVPGVSAVAVVGRPDTRSGEQVVAAVVGAAGVDPAELQGQVVAHCAERLARFKRPAVVTVLPALPRGVTGKVRKGLLREMLAQPEESR